MARTSLETTEIAGRLARLSAVDEHMARTYPGASAARQPVHTCYVPADRVGARTLNTPDSSSGNLGFRVAADA